MIEKVAKAIDECAEWPAKTYRTRVATAAIEAMRVPSEAQYAVIDVTSGVAEIYTSMIEAALAEQP